MQRISVSGVQEKSVRMTLLDHIILADEQYYSFKDNKKLQPYSIFEHNNGSTLFYRYRAIIVTIP